MRIGTRGSALALAQARPVAERLGGELVVLRTTGDEGRGVGDKSRWVDRIEDALLAGEIDVALHSAKDVPGELAPGLELVAAPERADVRDALVGVPSLDDLPRGARVGTSSLRRRAQLLALRPDLEVVELRGNVDTRLRKLRDGQADAVLLAAAGLQRLGLETGTGLDPDVFVPAPGQGTLVLEARTEDAARFTDVDDPAAHAALDAERAVAQALGASCQSAIGVWYDGAEVHTFVGGHDGATWIRDRAPVETAVQRLVAVGAQELV
jgi:hydroxymethylbilane synthase